MAQQPFSTFCLGRSPVVAILAAFLAGCAGPPAASATARASVIHAVPASSMVLGNGSPRLRLTAGCDMRGRWTCERPSRLEVLTDDGDTSQQIVLPTLAGDQAPQAHYGPLDGTYATRSASFALGDINGDQQPDLLIAAGREGAYGGFNYDVYLADPRTGEFRKNATLSELSVGMTPPIVIGAQIQVGAKSGCCLQVQETYALRSDRPVLVRRVTTDSTDTTRAPVVTVEQGKAGR